MSEQQFAMDSAAAGPGGGPAEQPAQPEGLAGSGAADAAAGPGRASCGRHRAMR